MRNAVLPLGLLLLTLPACAGYGPVDPATRATPVRAPAPATVVPPIDDAARTEALDASTAEGYLAARGLMVPVAGVEAHELRDSFTAGRDGGARRHNAIDIMARRGTPVLAADSGRVLRLSRSSLGGITIYATDPAERLVYYYAHLDGYHQRLAEGMVVARGDTLGYVGSTGNASANEPHLHFQVMRMPEGRRGYWNGEPVNPFPVLVQSKSLPRNEVRQAGEQVPVSSGGSQRQR